MKIKVAVVDDSITTTLVVKKILTTNGFEVVGTFTDPAAFVESFMKDLDVDITIIDIIMPGMNGIEAIRKVRAFDENAKFIVLSSLGESYKETAAALEAGALDILSKPVNEQILVRALNRALGINQG
ncbi:MAG: response regulator [Pseudomonadota bacterium]